MVDRLRVLIADDNAEMLDAVKRVLQGEFDVVAAVEKPTAVLTSVSELTSASRISCAASALSILSTPSNSGMLAACSVFNRRM